MSGVSKGCGSSWSLDLNVAPFLWLGPLWQRQEHACGGVGVGEGGPQVLVCWMLLCAVAVRQDGCRHTPNSGSCLSDECEEVEHQCQKTIQQLEAVLGEPLQSYF